MGIGRLSVDPVGYSAAVLLASDREGEETAEGSGHGRSRCADASMHGSGAFAAPTAALHQASNVPDRAGSAGSLKNSDSASLIIVREISAQRPGSREFRSSDTENPLI